MHPDHRSIGELAYRLWQARGCPDGTAELDWLEAERQLANEARPEQIQRRPPEAASGVPVTPSGEGSTRARALRSNRLS
jgi:LmbE family N-acetylglucosaminyl deacetylase